MDKTPYSYHLNLSNHIVPSLFMIEHNPIPIDAWMYEIGALPSFGFSTIPQVNINNDFHKNLTE